MPKIGEVKVTLRIWKDKEGVHSTNRFYATIVENEENAQIKALLKEHGIFNQHHLDISL